MTRCRICGGSGCPSCQPPQRLHATVGDLFESFLAESLPVSPRPIHGDSGASALGSPQAVWVSSRLDYFRHRTSALSTDIGFHGCRSPKDGAYRRLDPFWLSWLHHRVERLAGAQKAAGRDRLQEIVIEAINAGGLPESYDDPGNWPKIVPAGYQPPEMEISARYWPPGVDDSGHVR